MYCWWFGVKPESITAGTVLSSNEESEKRKRGIHISGHSKLCYYFKNLNLLTTDWRKRLSRTFASGPLTCCLKQSSPVQLAQVFMPSYNRLQNIFYSNYTKTESNFFSSEVGGWGRRRTMTKKLAKEGQHHAADKAVWHKHRCPNNG